MKGTHHEASSNSIHKSDSPFRVGNVLVALRCVEVRDKSLSFGFQTVFMSLFAMLPSPIIYGAIIDNTCLLWQVHLNTFISAKGALHFT